MGIKHKVPLGTTPEGSRRLTEGEAREAAARIVIELMEGVAARVDAWGLTAADERLANFSPDSLAYVARLVDTALVQVEVDWLGGVELA